MKKQKLEKRLDLIEHLLMSTAINLGSLIDRLNGEMQVSDEEFEKSCHTMVSMLKDLLLNTQEIRREGQS